MLLSFFILAFFLQSITMLWLENCIRNDKGNQRTRGIALLEEFIRTAFSRGKSVRRCTSLVCCCTPIETAGWYIAPGILEELVFLPLFETISPFSVLKMIC